MGASIGLAPPGPAPAYPPPTIERTDTVPAREEDFRPTSGRGAGLVGLGVLAVVVALDLLDAGIVLPPWGWALVALAAVLLWAALLRPRIWVGQGDLVLRTMLETVRIPLAAVESVVVRQVLAVSAGGRRYVCPALGQSRRTLVRGERRTAGPGGGGIGSFFGVGSFGDGSPAPDDEAAVRAHERALGVDYATYVRSRIEDLSGRARLEARVRPGSAAQHELAAGVRRDPAWPEIAALAVSVVALVVLLLA